MLFLNAWLALGLLAVTIPIVIHLLSRRSAKLVDWGAMQFLVDSYLTRRRRVLLEEILLMFLRCLLLAALAAALARPFLPAGSFVSWLIVLPPFLLAVLTLSAWAVLRSVYAWGRVLLPVGLVLLGLAGAAVAAERALGRRWAGGDRDVVLVIDTSASMALRREGRTQLDRALEEARALVRAAPRGAAFGLILADGAPRVVFPAPVTDRKAVLEALDDARMGAGVMNLPAAVAEAARCLAEGRRSSGQIALYGDDQAANWRRGDAAAWDAVRQAFARLPAPPPLVWRRLDAPASFRNLALAGLSLPPAIPGVEHEVDVEIRIENTGREVITPGTVELFEDGRPAGVATVGPMEPGTTAGARLRHRFSKPGVRILSARLAPGDDLAPDDSAERAVAVARNLHALVVDGNPAPRLLDRAAGFAALALAPVASAYASGDGGAPAEGFFIRPMLLDAPRIAEVPSFDAYHFVVLADVPRLPEAAAERLARYVAGGGGLLVTAGERIQPDFYNRWEHDGRPVMPARLVRRVVAPDDAPRRPAPDSFLSDALRPLADPRQSDLDGWTVRAFWELAVDAGDREAAVAARLDGGEPLFAEAPLGRGRVILSATPLGPAGGNLATKHAFVPLLQRLAQALAAPGRPELNLPPQPEVVFTLPAAPGKGPEAAMNGLRGTYYLRGGSSEALTRIDPRLDFTWGNSSPAPQAAPHANPNFSVRWTGSVVPPETGRYTFEVESPGLVRLWVDGALVVNQKKNWDERRAEMPMEAGRRHDLEVEYSNRGSRDAKLKLFWSGPKVGRQIIPRERLFVGRGERVTSNQTELATAVGPDGPEREVRVRMTGEALVLGVSGRALPGVYRVRGGRLLEQQAGDLLAEDGALAFTVQPDPAESRLEPVDEAVRAAAAAYVRVLEATSPEDVAKALAGQRFGREVSPGLLWLALACVVSEIVLTRWIASGRKTGLVEKAVLREKSM